MTPSGFHATWSAGSTSIFPAGTATPEYQTMMVCTAQLTTLFKHDLFSIRDYLWAQGMMSEEVRAELSEPSRTRSFKATLLVDYLTERIKDLPGDYHNLVKIVKKLGPWARDLAEHLDRTYTWKCKGTIWVCVCVLEVVFEENKRGGELSTMPEVTISPNISIIL